MTESSAHASLSEFSPAYLIARHACVLATDRDIAPRRGRRKSRRHDIPVTLPAARYPDTFNSSADKSLPLKHEYFLFGDQEDRCAA